MRKKKKDTKPYHPTKRDIKKYIPKAEKKASYIHVSNQGYKNEGYLITYTRHLEKRLRNLAAEKHQIEMEKLRLEQELHSLKNLKERKQEAKELKSLKQHEDDKERILKNEALVKKMVQDLYWEILDLTHKESEDRLILVPEEPVKEADKSKDDKESDFEFFAPYPTIPPHSPGSVGVAKQKFKTVVKEEKPRQEPYCKHCGSVLVKGESICHVCGNKVI